MRKRFYATVVHTGMMGDQSNWRWCGRCQGLWFAGNRAPDGTPLLGFCPASGYHTLEGSANYSLGYGVPINISHHYHLQSKWRWCPNCQGLFYAGTIDENGSTKTPDGIFDFGTCPGSPQGPNAGPHGEGGSLPYDLLYPIEENPPPIPGGQTNWYWCKKCQGLFFAGNKFPDGTPNLGVCPAGFDINNPDHMLPHTKEEGSAYYVISQV